MDAIHSRINEVVLDVLNRWDAIDTVAVLHFGVDRFDPSFFVSFDAYTRAEIPPGEEREAAFAGVQAFESSIDDAKDRFLLEDIPVRVEYKSILAFDNLLARARDPELGGFRGTTYGFYRARHADVLLERSEWFAEARGVLDTLPDLFWRERVQSLRGQMEHSFSDLSSATFGADDLFYQISLAQFIESSCELLFALNRRFDPPGRLMHAAVTELSQLPEEFSSRLENLLRSDGAMTPTRKREVAQLIATSLLRIS